MRVRKAAAGRGEGGPAAALAVTAFWLAGPPRPAAAWSLLTTLRSGLDGELAPTAFRTEAGTRARRLGRRVEALIVERLATGAAVELLGRANRIPRVLLRTDAYEGGPVLTLYGPLLSALPDVMRLVGFLKDLYDLLRPVVGVVDVMPSSSQGRSRDAQGAMPLRGAVSAPDEPPPAWLALLGPDRVEAIGLRRLLMAPVFLIEMLPDGGLLVVDTPLPPQGGRGAGRRSTALLDYLSGGMGMAGAPLRFERSEEFAGVAGPPRQASLVSEP